MNELLEHYKIIVLERNDDNIKEIINNDDILKLHKKSFKTLKDINKIKLSASYVRELSKNKESIHGLVPEIIEEQVNKTYGNTQRLI